MAVLVLALVAACSGDDDDSTATTTSEADDVTTTTEDVRPDGPTADVTAELTGGAGIFVGAPEDRELAAGYVESEYAASGTAQAFTAEGELPTDGMWTLTAGTEADYTTRVVVRRPESAEDFSGVVLLEWMNVSGGVDADPDWTTLNEEITREGHAWIGVSAQAIGVEGGDVRVSISGVEGADLAGKGLKGIDPDRYGSLEHPGDAFSFDMYSQIARAVRAGIPALDGLDPKEVIAVGESQSAAALVTYINGFQPMSEAFDAFFVHSRGAAGLPLPAPGESADLAGSIGGEPTTLRTDVEAPIMVLQAENDVVGVLRASGARQPDTDTFRLWEVAGTAHADLRLIGESTAEVIDCGAPINNGPLHVVAKAALHHLVDWVQGGDAPPEARRLELTEDESAVVRDDLGIAVGGIRTPPVDVPAQVLTGEQGPSDEVICLLSGSTLPIPDDQLAELYPSADAYEDQYGDAVDEAVEAGFVLDADRDAIEAYAEPDLIPG
ncbi:MAG: alpha/beta hydrolase domain-containing protein [Acidimicrobiales bacterium]|nr:alpha/beta hydrolase domain-containing protein [Acidimicrobiales bacterium]